MYLAQFLLPRETIEKYTMEHCRYFATMFAAKYGGQVVSIGSEVYEGYGRLEVEGNTMFYRVYKNPMHYLTKVGELYVDITGIFLSEQDMIHHYNAFYRNGLSEIGDDINVSLWPIGDTKELCDNDVVTDTNNVINMLSSYGDVFHLKDGYDVCFIVPHNISDKLFARALKIVFNTSTYKDSSGRIISEIKGNYIDRNGVLRKIVVPLDLERIDITIDNDDELLNYSIKCVLSIKYENLFGSNSFVDVWSLATGFNPYSVAEIFLPEFILKKSKYPYLGAIVESDLSQDVKNYLVKGDLYEAVSEACDYSSTPEYTYNPNKLHAELVEAQYNNVSRPGYWKRFLNVVTEDVSLKFIQKIITIDRQARIKISKEMKETYQRKSYHDLSEWSTLVTKVIWLKLYQTQRGIAHIKYGYSPDEIYYSYSLEHYQYINYKDMEFDVFINVYDIIKGILTEINKSIKFYYGINSLEDLLVVGGNIYLVDFSRSIYDDGQLSIIDQRQNKMFELVENRLGVYLIDEFYNKKSVMVDMMMFCYVSREYYDDNQIKSFCDTVLKTKMI